MSELLVYLPGEVLRHPITHAVCNAYALEGETEVLFLAWAESCPDARDELARVAEPQLEISFRCPHPANTVFSAARAYEGLPAYDERLDEWVTNLYYLEHQGVEQVAVAFDAARDAGVSARIEGLLDGTEPGGLPAGTRLVLQTCFQIDAEARRRFG